MASKSNSTQKTGRSTSNKPRSTSKTTSKSPSKTTRKTSPAKKSTKASSTNRKRTSRTKKKSTQKKRMKYEIQLIFLFAFTILSALSLHSGSMGVAGEFMRNLYLGLFASTAYIFPYYAAILIFLGINRNLRPVRNRYMLAFSAAFLAILLLFTVGTVDLIGELLQFNNMKLMSFNGLQMTYKNGISGQGGGVIGTLLTFIFTTLLGKIGTYVVVGLLFILALILGTKMSIIAIWEKRKVAAEMASQKVSQIDISLPEINLPKAKGKSKSVKDARKQFKELKKSTSIRKTKTDKVDLTAENAEKASPKQNADDLMNHKVRESMKSKVKDFGVFDSSNQLETERVKQDTLPAHDVHEDEKVHTNVIGQVVTAQDTEEDQIDIAEENQPVKQVIATGVVDADGVIIHSPEVDEEIDSDTDADADAEIDEDVRLYTSGMYRPQSAKEEWKDDELEADVRILDAAALAKFNGVQNSENEEDDSFDDGLQIPIKEFEEGEMAVESHSAIQAQDVSDRPVTNTIKQEDANAPERVQNPESGEVAQSPAVDGQKLKNSDIDSGTKAAVESTIKKSTKITYENYKLPSLKLLNTIEPPKGGKSKQEVLDKAKKLEETLSHFGVEAKVIQISRGPTITMFELQPSPGIKVSKITNLSDDIALALAATQVRIVAPIPGKSAVGVEIPNENKTMVGLKDVIDSEAFKTAKSKLTFALGKDISGKPVVANLAKMPHMLIAGQTGSGKSVCVNALISSILFNAKPDEVKFLMIDPKVVELSTYNGIPHLILPVVTDPKKAAVALNWAVQEMTRRYQLFAETGVKDSDSYNRKAVKYNKLLVDDEEPREKMSKIVVIIDELADLMMVAPDQVEDAICRLAQMARAAGIHLIVATQRPSVDVITGIIKANIPSRIAFSVSSQTDSRTILDMSGAEKLLGMGDMLYYPTGMNKPQRIQGAFISDEEVESLVENITEQVDPVAYDNDILETAFVAKADEHVDEYLKDAIELVVHSGQASASMLQRKFRVGYNRAARLVDEMEERGIVGPSRGSKPREVLISQEELEELNV